MGHGGGSREGDNRSAPRARKRLRVRFGVEALEKTAFTKNLSETGICLRTNQVLPPGTTLQVEIQTPEASFSLWAKVVWAKKVPPQLAHVLDCGMGIRFIQPGEDWVAFCRTWHGGRPS